MNILQLLLGAIPVDVIIVFVIRKVAPKAPTWVASVAGKAVSEVAKVVSALDKDAYDNLTPAQKRARAVQAGRMVLDASFDDVPAWGGLSEDRRDRIVSGIAELVLFVLDLTAPERRVARKSLRKSKD